MRFFIFSCRQLPIFIWASWSFVDVWCLWTLWRGTALSNWNLKILLDLLIIFINLISPCFWNFRKIHNLVAFKHLNWLIFFKEVLRRTSASRWPLFILLLFELDQYIRRSTLRLVVFIDFFGFLSSRLPSPCCPNAAGKPSRTSRISLTCPVAQVATVSAIC